MKKNVFLFAVIFVTSVMTVRAGSPLYQVSFFSAYYMNEKVQMAEQLEWLDGTLAAYLLDETASIGEKAAVINALQWNEKGKNNVTTFTMHVGRKYGKSFDAIDFDQLTSSELFCLGYMKLMEKGSKSTDAIAILEKAKAKNTKSYTLQLFSSIASANDMVSKGNSCSAWSTCNAVRENTSLDRDLNDEAIQIIFTGVDELKDACK